MNDSLWRDTLRSTDYTFHDRWRMREDGKISRCSCGAWVYADNECRACGPQIPQDCPQTLPMDTTPFPRLSTGPYVEGLSPTAEMSHCAPNDHLDERRAV